MARPESEEGGHDHGASRTDRGRPVSGAMRAGGNTAVDGGAAAANLRHPRGPRRPGSPAPAAGRVGEGGSLSLLLDSVILIDHFNGRPEATRYLAEVAGEAALSVITRAEVLAGFDAENSGVAEGLLDCFPILGIGQPVADLAARLRREFRWKMPDAFQAALAQYHGLSLVTRNLRDFPPHRHKDRKSVGEGKSV